MLPPMSTQTDPQSAQPTEPPKPPSEAAKRALAEAAARRREPPVSGAKEFNGRQGPDPVRYGDWEVKGLASDF